MDNDIDVKHMNVYERVVLFKHYTKEFVSDDLAQKLVERGFFTAPASTTHHGNYEGGLFDHSLLVAKWLCDLTNRMQLAWQNPRSPKLIGMFHDLCKLDNYIPVMGNEYTENDNGKVVCISVIKEYVYNKDILLTGHGDKSVMMLSEYFQLTEEEIMCIRYHMGAFTDKEEWRYYTNAIHKYPNVLWTHTADMLASHVEGV